MSMRKITSMTMLSSLFLLFLNSIILYVVPEGRVAYWADWHFWGLSKTQWGDQHITVGFLFLLAGLLHIFYNWVTIKSYMKNKVKEMRIFTPSFNAGLLVTVIVAVGTYFNVPPMSTVLHLGASFKEAGAEKYGEPPYGHAELSSLKLFSQKEQIDLDKALDLLKQAGMQVEGATETLAAIARKNAVTPQQVYAVIRPARTVVEGQADGANITFPDEPKPGFGRKTLEEACTELKIEYKKISEGLQAKGVKVEAGKTIHEIAEANGKEPMEIFEAIRSVVLGE